MSNVFDEIYQEAFQNRLVKIAQDNKLDPNEFIASLDKIAAGRAAALAAGIKNVAATTGGSFKNLLEAAKGLTSATTGKTKQILKNKDLFAGKQVAEGMQQFKSHIGKSKAALGILGGTGITGTAGTMALTSKK
jgi:hypothetical protein